jgi:hypothetical protein
MAEYVLNRNFVLRSMTGHSVNFVKNVPTFVPALIEREARGIGAERVDGANPDMLDPETHEVAPLSHDERAEQIRTAFALLTERNDSKDFTGAGVPSVKAIEKLVDFDVDRNEVVALWQAYRAGE